MENIENTEKSEQVKVKKSRAPKKVVEKVAKVKQMNPWALHVKNYCIEHNVKYRDALRSEECKGLYRKTKSELALK